MSTTPIHACLRVIHAGINTWQQPAVHVHQDCEVCQGKGQLIAGVVLKKAVAGSSDVLIDTPVGPGAKVRSSASVNALATRLGDAAAVLEMRLAVHRSNENQPVGFGISLALEAHDALQVLRGDADALTSMRNPDTRRPRVFFGRVRSDSSHGIWRTCVSTSGSILAKWSARHCSQDSHLRRVEP